MSYATVQNKHIKLVGQISPSAKKKKTILLVEDNESTRELLTIALKKEYSVYSCATSGKALEILTKHDIDAVILDFILPDLTGVELLKQIKSPGNKMAHLPVIMMTMVEDATNCNLCRDEGAQAYLQKSWGLGILGERILEELEKGIRKTIFIYDGFV